MKRRNTKTMKMITKGMSVVVTLAMILPVLPSYAETVSGSTSNQTYTDSSNGGHAVYVSGQTITLTNPTITKTGDSLSEDADFYGTNAAVLAENGANLTIKGGSITSDGTHANALFSYGTGTVNVSNANIITKGNNSGGLMTTGGATMNASDLTISTSGNSSAAIRSDRGGGDVNVSGGSYTTSGTGSPVIYSTADVDIENASLESSASEAVVIEGGNSVGLKNCTVTGNNTKLNGQARNYDSIFIYQSMSGDASSGTSEFTSVGGSITSKNGDTFYITNTTTKINLTNTQISNAGNGDFLVAESAAWGKSGSNGGKVTLNTSNQTFAGDMEIDAISSLNLNMNSSSAYKGAINKSGDKGTVAVVISDDSSWSLTGNSYIDSLSCDADAIELNGHKLYVNGEEYVEGTESKDGNTSIKKLKITGESKNIAAGKKLRLKVKVTPANASRKGIIWTSSNKKYAVVNSNGLVKTKAAGKGKRVKITVKSKDGKIKAHYSIRIMKGVVKKVKIAGKSTVKAGGSITLKSTVTATSGAYKKLTWTSDNTDYATVNAKGQVKAKQAGKGHTVTITAKALDGSGKKAKKTIRIK